MKRPSIRIGTPFLLSLLIASPLLAADHRPAPLVLITAEEARRPDQPATRSAPARARPDPQAPKIVVEKPPGAVIEQTPFPIRISFVTAPDAAVDLASLKVEVIKLVPFSIVDRLRPYAGPQGIDVPGADIPKGRHTVRLSISDTKGRVGGCQKTWEVR